MVRSLAVFADMSSLGTIMHSSTAPVPANANAIAMQVHLLNKPQDAVCEMLEGLVASVPHLQRLDGFPEVRWQRCRAALVKNTEPVPTTGAISTCPWSHVAAGQGRHGRQCKGLTGQSCHHIRCALLQPTKPCPGSVVRLCSGLKDVCCVQVVGLGMSRHMLAMSGMACSQRLWRATFLRLHPQRLSRLPSWQSLGQPAFCSS